MSNTLTYLLGGILLLFLIGGTGFGVGNGLSPQTAIDVIGGFAIIELTLLAITVLVTLATQLLPLIAIALVVYTGSLLLKQSNFGTGMMSTVKETISEQPGIYPLLILALLALFAI